MENPTNRMKQVDSFVAKDGLQTIGNESNLAGECQQFQRNSHMISAVVGFTIAALSLNESSMFVASQFQIDFRLTCFLNLQENIGEPYILAFYLWCSEHKVLPQTPHRQVATRKAFTAQ